MQKPWVLFLLLLMMYFPAGAQIGGKRTFTFLELPANATLAGLGGVNVSAISTDGAQLLSNPALLRPEKQKQVSFSYAGFVSDISQNTLTYSFAHQKSGAWGFGLTFLDYGDFTQRDAAGQELGKFSVNDYALSFSHARTTGVFSLGAAVKLAVSGIASYKAVGLLTDLGGLFKHPEKDFTIGLAFKNIGYQLKGYDGQGREAMPLNVQIGTTYKPEHMPLRFSITAQHLQQFDITYLDTTGAGNNSLGGATDVPQKNIGDKIARHFVIGGELLLSKNFNVRMGYNHLRRRELRLDNVSGGAGFSLGTLIRIRGFQLDYAHAFYHVAGGSNYITISTDLQQILKPKGSKTGS